MSEQSLRDLWISATAAFKDQINSPMFNLIFTRSDLTALSTKEMILAVDNKRIQSYIRSFGEPNLLAHIHKTTGIRPAKITYQVRPQTKTNKPAKAESFDPRLFVPSTAPVYTLDATSSEFEVDPHLAANLNPKYTFESFIVGNKNRLAFAASQAVAAAIGQAYNPLYLYGGVGLGKTHLMQAIGNAVINQDSQKKVLYVACENFLNEFVASIKRGNPDSFKKKYRNIDVFLVDDIQFIAGRDGVQEEFFHTFNALHQGNKQIVISSDKRPSEIGGLEERLSSRFSMGMVTDIQFPDKETRTAILQAKCQEKQVSLPITVIEYIASQVETNIRELEGALNTVIADLMSRNVPPTIQEVKTSLRTIISQQTAARRSPGSLLLEIVCNYYQLSSQEVTGSSRKQELVRARQVLMYLLKHEAGMTYPLIAKEIGDRDHTTIMHGVSKITVELKKDSALLSDLQKIKELFYEYK